MNEIIGKRIADRRKELKLTQQDLANRLGYKTKSTIAKIETGVNDITQSKLADIAKALRTTPSYLMGWEDETESIDELEQREFIEELQQAFSDNPDKRILFSMLEGATRKDVRKVRQIAELIISHNEE